MRHSEFPKHRAPVDGSQGYELRDISIPVIGRWVITLFIFMAASALLAWVFFYLFLPSNTHDASISPLKPQRILPQEPRLQAYPRNEMRDFRATEQTNVDNTAWLDKNAGKVRLPIDQALDIIAKRGITVGQTAASTNSAGYDPTASTYKYPVPIPVGTDQGYKPPVTYRKYPY